MPALASGKLIGLSSVLTYPIVIVLSVLYTTTSQVGVVAGWGRVWTAFMQWKTCKFICHNAMHMPWVTSLRLLTYVQC